MILVVHDVEETRNGIEMLLQAVGHQVETARNETEAIAQRLGARASAARRHRPSAARLRKAGNSSRLVRSRCRGA